MRLVGRLAILLTIPLCVALALAVPALAQPKALKGVDDWLVYTSDEGNLADYLHSNTLTDAELADIAGKVSRIDAVLGSRGTTFLWVVPPNTPTIYPESMPKRFKPVGAQSKREQLGAVLAARNERDFLDLTPALLRAKKTNKLRVYRKTDTHWTALGAFAAYQEIMQRMADVRPELSKQLAPAAIDTYTLAVVPGFSGDLAAMLGLQGDLTEDLPTLTSKSARTQTVLANLALALSATQPSFAEAPVTGVTIGRPQKGVVTFADSTRCPGPSLVMVHDSFGLHIAPWIAIHFCSATLYFDSAFPDTAAVDRRILTRSPPTFVVVETAERFATGAYATGVLDRLARIRPAIAH